MLPADWEAPDTFIILVWGEPVPKQSFRVGKKNYQTAKVKAWQEQIGWAAKASMAGRSPMDGILEVRVNILRTKKRGRLADWDNLAKCALDGLNKIAFHDDSQIRKATVMIDEVEDNPCIQIGVRPLP